MATHQGGLYDHTPMEDKLDDTVALTSNAAEACGCDSGRGDDMKRGESSALDPRDCEYVKEGRNENTVPETV